MVCGVGVGVGEGGGVVSVMSSVLFLVAFGQSRDPPDPDRFSVSGLVLSASKVGAISASPVSFKTKFSPLFALLSLLDSRLIGNFSPSRIGDDAVRHCFRTLN